MINLCRICDLNPSLYTFLRITKADYDFSDDSDDNQGRRYQSAGKVSGRRDDSDSDEGEYQRPRGGGRGGGHGTAAGRNNAGRYSRDFGGDTNGSKGWADVRRSGDRSEWVDGDKGEDAPNRWNDARSREAGRRPEPRRSASGSVRQDRNTVIVENYVDSDSDNDERAQKKPVAKKAPPTSARPAPPSRPPEVSAQNIRNRVNSESFGAAVNPSIDEDSAPPPLRGGTRDEDSSRVSGGPRYMSSSLKPAAGVDVEKEEETESADAGAKASPPREARSRPRSPPSPREAARTVMRHALSSSESFANGTHTTDDRTTARYTRSQETYYSGTSPSELDRKMELANFPQSYVHTALESGVYTDLVQCVMTRDKSALMDTCYNLYLEETNKLLIYAQKKALSRTSNYQFFDMTRPMVGKHLSKKSGNFLGKLRAQNMQATDYALITQASEKEEIAAIVYEQIGFLDQVKEGSQPRRMTIMVPTLDADAIPVPNKVSESGSGSLVDLLKSRQTGKMFVFQSKEPKYENGNYRLNFHGRVSVPSVKNFQLVSSDEPDHVVCQFGKIGDDRFHLDFKAPLNAFQAFAIALTQFNL